MILKNNNLHFNWIRYYASTKTNMNMGVGDDEDTYRKKLANEKERKNKKIWV